MVEYCYAVSFVQTVMIAGCGKSALYAECHYAECRYAEWGGTIVTIRLISFCLISSSFASVISQPKDNVIMTSKRVYFGATTTRSRTTLSVTTNSIAVIYALQNLYMKFLHPVNSLVVARNLSLILMSKF